MQQPRREQRNEEEGSNSHPLAFHRILGADGGRKAPLRRCRYALCRKKAG